MTDQLRVLFVALSVACQMQPLAKAPPDGSAIPAPAKSEAALDLWWSPDLELPALAEASAALERSDPVGLCELVKGDDTQLVRTCRQWFSLHAAGYDPMTTLEMQADGGARVRCGTLSLLERAKPAQSSHVRELSFADPAILAALPAELATAVSDDEYRRLTAATSRGENLAEYDTRARVIDESHDTLRVLEGDGASVILLSKQALGDFDGDTVEDLALAVVNAMTQGTLSSTQLLVFTRKTDDARLERIDPPALQLP